MYTHEEIMNLFIIYGQCHKNISRTCRRFNEKYPNAQALTNRIFRRIHSNFIHCGSAQKRRISPKTVRTEDNIINVLTYFEAHPQSSISCAEEELDISWSTIQRILSEFKMHPYKFSKVQSLLPGDFPQRVAFCENILIHLQEDPQFLRKMIWTDESKFSRNGINNCKNKHFWATVNPNVTRETGFQDKFSFNVFALMMDNQMRYVIYDENLTSDRYIHILRTCVEPFLENLPLNMYQNRWFQLDGAPAHSTASVATELNRLFDDRWFRRNGPWNWPPRSPDLTPLDFYLWPTVKEVVYSTPINTRQELENRVVEALENINLDVLRTTCTTAVERRILKCLEVNGQHFEHLL